MRVSFLLGLTLGTSSVLYAQTPPVQPVPEGMALISAGEFWMGTDETDGTDNNQGTNTPLNANDARPRHRATNTAFYMDITEVTCAQYKKFCDETKYPTPPDWKDGQFASGKENVPVTRVNWYEATAYAKWAGKRLPTETEWERAARGTEGRIFPWGNDFDSRRLNDGSGGPIAVGTRPGGASPEGIMDLAGNVFEWTSSWFDAYPNAPTRQPDFGKKLKVIRGGAWISGYMLAKGWFRGVNRPQSRIEWVGFRCVKDAQ